MSRGLAELRRFAHGRARGSGARDRASGLPQVRAELVGPVREHGGGPRQLVLHDGSHRFERRRDLGQARLDVRRIAEALHQAVEEEDDRQRRRVRHDHHALRPRVGVRALQHRVRGVGHSGDGDLRRHGRIEVLRDLLRPRGHGALDVARACVARDRVVRGLQRLELGERGPLGVDRQPPAVGELQAELHDLATDAKIRDEHAGRQLGEVLAQDVLAGTAFGGSAGEHRRQTPDHLAALDVGLAAFLLAQAQLLERPARAVQAGAQLLARQVAVDSRVGDPPQFGGLRLQPRLHDRERCVADCRSGCSGLANGQPTRHRRRHRARERRARSRSGS